MKSEDNLYHPLTTKFQNLNKDNTNNPNNTSIKKNCEFINPSNNVNGNLQK